MIEFKDCEYRFVIENTLYCKNKEPVEKCDNCKGNIHLNCMNYNPKSDMCLKWFESNVSEHFNECSEKQVSDDKKLQQKWSN